VISLVTIIWNGERHGFPWRPLIEEWLAAGVQVVAVIPGQDQDDMFYLIRKDYPDVERLGVPAFSHYQGISDAVNKGIAIASGEVVLHVQGDEHLEASPALLLTLQRHGPKQLLAFPRLDFTLDMTHVTPVFEGEPPVVRSMPGRLFPQLRALDDAMHLGPVTLDVPALYLSNFPIFHYHGLKSEAQWQTKETDFQQSLYVGHAFGEVDKKIALGGEAAWAPGPLKRAREFTGQHPPRMLQWLKDSWMWRAEK